MKERYLPGGDKNDYIREVEHRAFYERVEVEKEEILSALKTVVSCWTANEIDAGNNPTFENFRDMYPEWDHEELYATIGEEMHRVKHGLSGVSKAV